MNMQRAIGISTGPATHLDHLGVLCILFDIPLIVTDEGVYETARRFYPQLDVHLHSWNDLSLDSLAQHADILFGCGKYWAESLRPAFECVSPKQMRFVFCPHGNSDKGHSLRPEEAHPQQDIALIYGDHMYELLKNTGALSSINHVIRTGNYRHSYYLDHRAFYDDLAGEMVFQHLPKDKKILLYAPTWPNKENPSPVFDLSEELIKQLSPTFTLLIKWHPLLEEFYPGQTHHFLGRYSGHPGVHFVTDFPAIYPLLMRSDAYIGDFSSIGYDYLLFDRPMYFLPRYFLPSSSKAGPLFNCGFTLMQEHFTSLAAYLEKTWEENQSRFHAAKKALYSHAFGDPKDSKHLKEEIFETIRKTCAKASGG